MWILYTILGIALVLGAALLLPVRLIIENEERDEFRVYYRVLGKNREFKSDDREDEKQKDSPITRVKEKLNKRSLSEASAAVRELFEILEMFLKELIPLIGRCRMELFRLQVVCGGEDAAATAITYGVAAAAIHGFTVAVDSVMGIRKRGKQLDLRCDFSGAPTKTRYKFVIRARVYRLLIAFLGLTMKQAARETKSTN